jgi:hypothetical protein
MDFSPGRRAVWVALADQFLDTETRYLIPSTALRCVEAGLELEARDIWRHEVFPVVGHNLFEVAGEWACWPEEWLVEQIAAQRYRPRCLASLVQRACARICCCAYEDRWTAIDRCIRLLEETPAALRCATADDLELLARLYFDFCPASPGSISPERRLELRRRYRPEFLPIFRPLVVPGGAGHMESESICAARVDTALLP